MIEHPFRSLFCEGTCFGLYCSPLVKGFAPFRWEMASAWGRGYPPFWVPSGRKEGCLISGHKTAEKGSCISSVTARRVTLAGKRGRETASRLAADRERTGLQTNCGLCLPLVDSTVFSGVHPHSAVWKHCASSCALQSVG